MTLSLDTELQAEMALTPNFNLQAIDSAINAMQSQINELAEQRHQIELSMVSVCITHIFLTLIRPTVQSGLQLHIGVISRALSHFPCSGGGQRYSCDSYSNHLEVDSKCSFTCLDAFRIALHAEGISLWLTQQGFAVQTLTFPNNQATGKHWSDCC